MGNKYKNPPIIEAVCEFRFEPGSAWDLAVPGLVYERIRDTFPKRRPTRDVQLGVRQVEAGLEQELKTTERIRFLRDDEKAFMQVGPDQVAIHHLKPYPSWKGFQPLIMEGFSAYSKAASPKGIQRIGLRYINRIEIPGEKVKLEDHFEFYPFVGTKLPQDFGPFIVGIEVPYEDARDMLRVQLTSVRGSAPNMIAVLHDLDYFLAKPGSVAVDDTQEWIGVAHDKVEEVFEACIKDSLRKIFIEEK
ncbi:hypothetical protein AMJ44_11930 [candidate division WOR-1 bacterium DG_54_3]|uniref:TIGR04255 family protein n=1 Tax=candidate division WOR-1 bacterium DG_54_3 TaxID=1703775 RepID=A0A0S7XRU9_UNCSA|nr:MAG: hypothetical protein AMJ44_11930 [candidate division WOR-1 bacterium DG_54_3]